MAKFQKGNELWKNNPGFKKNIGRFTTEVNNDEKFKEARKKGSELYKQRNRMKRDLFKQITGEDKLQKGIDVVMDNAIKKGNTKQLLDLLKIIAPNELDITSDGKQIQMGQVILNGKELELAIGEEVEQKEED